MAVFANNLNTSDAESVTSSTLQLHQSFDAIRCYERSEFSTVSTFDSITIDHVVEKVSEQSPVELPDTAPKPQDALIKLADSAPKLQDAPVELPDTAPKLQDAPVELADLSLKLLDALIKLADAAPKLQGAPVELPDSAPNLQDAPIDSATSGTDSAHEDALDNCLPFGLTPVTKLDFNVKHNFLVDEVLVQNQSMIIFGPPKCLKTSISLDLAISLCTGKPFLGRFNVPKPRKVAVLSGESGKVTLSQSIKRITESKGCKQVDLDDMSLSDTCPVFYNNAIAIDDFGKLAKHKIEVLIIDPAYFALSGADTSNLMSMGNALKLIFDRCTSLGITPILVHHSKKTQSSGDKYKALPGITFAGFAENTRQWMAIETKKPFEPETQTHTLSVSVAGSAGHSQRLNVMVREKDEDPNAENRVWVITVDKHDEAHNKDNEKKPSSKSKKEVDVIDAIKAASEERITKTNLYKTIGKNRTNEELVESMIKKGTIKKFESNGKNGKKTTYYKLPAPTETTDPPGAAQPGDVESVVTAADDSSQGILNSAAFQEAVTQKPSNDAEVVPQSNSSSTESTRIVNDHPSKS